MSPPSPSRPVRWWNTARDDEARGALMLSLSDVPKPEEVTDCDDCGGAFSKRDPRSTLYPRIHSGCI